MKKSNVCRVTLRFDWAKDKRTQNLYLDYYPAITDAATGKQTRRQFLKMHVQPLLTAKGEWQSKNTGTFAIKVDASGNAVRDGKVRFYVYNQQDTETIQTALMLADQRQRDLFVADMLTEDQKDALTTQQKAQTRVLDYYAECDAKRIANGVRANVWKRGIRMFGQYLAFINRPDLTFAELTQTICDKYRVYLCTDGISKKGTALKTNTRAVYLVNFASMINDAVKDGYLQKKPRIEAVTPEDANREFLEMEELHKLVATEFQPDVLKRACLFSALTGLRYSDIVAIQWDNIKEDRNGALLRFVVKKTSKPLDIPLTEEAVKLCGERGADGARIFVLPKCNNTGRMIERWTKAAGVKKHVTFHTFRHTFATLQLDNGTAITTIQQILGHSSLATTQIYAKVLDTRKREAVERLKLNINI